MGNGENHQARERDAPASNNVAVKFEQMVRNRAAVAYAREVKVIAQLDADAG